MQKICYTIGVESSYDKYLAAEPNAKKLGRYTDEHGEEYPGGWVWKSADDAYKFLAGKKASKLFPNKKLAVYVLALPQGWSTDVSREPWNDEVHNLLTDARIVKKCFNREVYNSQRNST